MSDVWHCPACQQVLVFSEIGQGDYPWACGSCMLAVQIIEDEGTVKSRRWDKQLARGIEELWPLTACRPAQANVEE